MNCNRKYNETGISYDKPGNLLSLTRRDANGQQQTLQYTYLNGGNRLSTVSGLSPLQGTLGCIGSYNRTYSYNANGAVTGDGKLAIQYNAVGLPKIYSGTAEGIITYSYTAEGVKLTRKKEQEVREYIDGIEYANNGAGTPDIDIVRWNGGLLRKTGSSYAAEYFLTDHLGNIRVVYNALGAVLQKQDYYPFGKEIPRKNRSPRVHYGYNGKELQTAMEQLDYGSRFYDPVVGRWPSYDPLAEKQYNWNPYNYVLDNTLKLIDPNGTEPTSTHTDRFGNVIAIYNDGDNGVYRHAGRGNQVIAEIKSRYSTSNRSAGGEYMGKTLTPLGFANFESYEQQGIIVPGKNAKIDFKSSWARSKYNEIVNNPTITILDYFKHAGSQGKYDVKYDQNIRLNTPYKGSIFRENTYMSARDLGNVIAGSMAEKSIIPSYIIRYAYGLYNLTGNSKESTALIGISDVIMGVMDPIMIFQKLGPIVEFGENSLSNSGIKLGIKIQRERGAQ